MALVEAEAGYRGRRDVCVNITNVVTSSEGESNRGVWVLPGVDWFVHHRNCVLSAMVYFQKAWVVGISEKSYQNSVWTQRGRDVLQYFCAREPLSKGLSCKRSLYARSTVVILTCIFDHKAWDFHNTKNLAKHTCITNMNLNNLDEVLGDLKQDVKVDTTSILGAFFSLLNSG